MAFVSKKRKVADTKVDANKSYSLKEASALVKQITTCKFDASVDLHIRLGVDPKKADQAIRGTVTLPHGTGKTKRVLVLCTPDKEAAAKNDAKRTAQDLDEAQKVKDDKAKEAAKNAKLTVSSLREIGGAMAGEFIPSDPAPEYLKSIAETEKEILKAVVELREEIASGKMQGVDFTKDPNQSMFTV